MMHTVPIKLERKLDSRIWGGETLGPWLGLADAPDHLAESWQVYEHNRIVGGPFDGRTLADVAAEQGAALLGTRSVDRNGSEFPLLAKFLDAADDLSLQVHPDDEYAHTVEAGTGFHGKTEAWHVIQAAPGAQVIHGFAVPADRERFAAAIADGTILQLLRRVPVQEGDTIFVPAGTVHAINAGIMLFEIQQKSDLTYRVFDYDRRDATGQTRELHVERALDVTRFDVLPPAQVKPRPLSPGRELLVECPYFAMERWHIDAAADAATDSGSFEILTCIDGGLTLSSTGGDTMLTRGESLVLPAQLGPYRLAPDNTATILRCYVP